MDPNNRNQTGHSVLLLLTGLSLLTLFLRLWPVLALLLATLLGVSIWTLACARKRPEAAQQMPADAPQPQPEPHEPVSEQELLTLAFGLLQRRITEQVTAVHPRAKWVWGEPGARERLAAGGPLIILLNGAGGYQKAAVQVSDLQFYSLFYLPQNDMPALEDEPAGQDEDTTDSTPADYGLLAFEWVEANLQRLTCETAANGQTGYRIPAEELPHGDSWPAICKELIRGGFSEAEPVANGIQIKS